MAFPLIGILGALVTAVGGYTLYWYHGLSREEQQEADRLAAQYAKSIYRKSLDQLHADQLAHIQELVRKRLFG